MTNLLSSPEDFSTTWGKPATAVINVNQTTAPDGTSTADQLIDNSGGGSATPYVTQDITVSTSTQYVYSVFAKQDQLQWIVLSVSNFTTPANIVAWFDLSSGVKGTVQAGFAAAGIYDIGDGWYRPWVSFISDVTDTNGSLRIYMDDADNGGRTVDLDGTSSIFIWGAVAEPGASPTPYTSEAGIVVPGSTSTRTGPGLTLGMMGRMGAK